MNNQSTPENCLLRSISASTKARIAESLFPNPHTCYADEITHNLFLVKRVLDGLKELGVEDEGEHHIAGELALALSELLEQQVEIAIILVQGAAFEKGSKSE